MLTQKQLAERIGVSQQAVSFALNGGGTLKQATRDYIIAEAQKAGYRINGASRMFREGRTNSIALIVHGNFHTLPGLMLSALRRCLRERDMHLTLFGAEPEDFADPLNPPRLVRELSADGFLVMYDRKNSEQLAEQIANYRIPSVWVNMKRPENAVYPDDYSISRRLVRELVARHEGRLLYFSPEPDDKSHYSVADRRDGFLRGVAECGRRGDAMVSPRGEEAVHEAAAKVLSQKEGRPAIVVTYAVEDAQAFYFQARLLGLRVPQDLVIGTFTWLRAQIAHHELTRALVPLHICGVKAFEMLLKRIEDPKANFESVAVDDFVFREG
jgi:DNA-binding LacI/PurR family transcriptional regulator